jgi:hypothetical protein
MDAPPAPEPGPLVQLAVLTGVGAVVCLVSLLPTGARTPVAAGLDAPTPAPVLRSPRHLSMTGSPAYAALAPPAASYSWPVAHRHLTTATAPSTSTGHSPGPTEPSQPQRPPGHEAPHSSARPCAAVNAAVDTFLTHFYAAHLKESPAQQVADLLAVDQYVTTHTVLVEHMVAPLVIGADAATTVFLEHLYAAHLEESPAEQAADVLALDRYLQTHTVLVEHLVEPLAGSDLSSC